MGKQIRLAHLLTANNHFLWFFKAIFTCQVHHSIKSIRFFIDFSYVWQTFCYKLNISFFKTSKKLKDVLVGPVAQLQDRISTVPYRQLERFEDHLLWLAYEAFSCRSRSRCNVYENMSGHTVYYRLLLIQKTSS